MLNNPNGELVQIKWVRTWLEKWAKTAELTKGGAMCTSSVEEPQRSYYNPPPAFAEMVERAYDEIVAEDRANEKYVEAAFWCAMLGTRQVGLMLRRGRCCVHKRRVRGEELLQQRLGRMIDSDRRKRKSKPKAR